MIYIRYFLKKFHLKKFWHLHNGDWHWLKEKPTPIASINRSLWRASVPSFAFHFMLGLSAIIATLGLLANSVAIIIGAMIIAPLIGPIMGMTYSTIIGNRRLLRRSSLTLLSGVILTIALSWIVASAVGLKTVDSEIWSRANPTLIDLGIAMAAGAAGAFANTRRRIADALPGVAIAVALVPPLSVVGIGLSLANIQLAAGSSLLFLTNLISIIFTGGLVFLFQSYGNLERAKHGLFFSTCMLFLLGFPLYFSLNNLLIEKNVHYQINDLIINRTETFANVDIESIVVTPRPDRLEVEMEVSAPIDSISQNQINLVRDFLVKQIGQSIELDVEVSPVRKLQAPALTINNE